MSPGDEKSIYEHRQILALTPVAGCFLMHSADLYKNSTNLGEKDKEDTNQTKIRKRWS